MTTLITSCRGGIEAKGCEIIGPHTVHEDRWLNTLEEAVWLAGRVNLNAHSVAVTEFDNLEAEAQAYVRQHRQCWRESPAEQIRLMRLYMSGKLMLQIERHYETRSYRAGGETFIVRLSSYGEVAVIAEQLRYIFTMSVEMDYIGGCGAGPFLVERILEFCANARDG